MSKNTCTGGVSEPLPAVECGPAFLKTGSELVQGLKATLDRAECQPGETLTQKRFGELIGIPKSTLNDWYHGRLVDQIRRFLCGLERLREPERGALLREICRDCPRLHDTRLAHDPGSVNALRALVHQPLGLTFIVGESDEARTFLITAMGNSAGCEVQACGLDVHRPDKFVPVQGVRYLDKSCSPTELRTVVRRVWPAISDSGVQILLFNGVWSAVPGFRTKIAALAAKRNVIVADDLGSDVSRVHQWQRIKTSLVVVDYQDRDEHRLNVRIETLNA